MKKIKIALMESYYHSTMLYTMCKIAKRPHTEVSVFTIKEVWDEVLKQGLNPKDYNIFLKGEQSSHKEFIEFCSESCDRLQIDYIFINTIRENYSYLKDYKNFNPKAKVIVTIHNLNSWFGKKLRFNYSKPLHTLPYFLIDSLISRRYIKKKLLPKIDAISVDYAPMIQHAEKLVDKPVFNLPYALNQNNGQKSVSNDILTIVIPGAIEKKRRDYHLVLDVFEKQRNVSLILLGRPVGNYGKSVIDRCEKMGNVVVDDWPSITFFEKYIPEEKYQKIMRDCDIILSPIKERTSGLGIMEEIAGTTKSFNPPFEAIKYGKFLIIPYSYPIDERLKTSTRMFSNGKELGEVINILKEENLSSLKEEATINAQKFSLPVFQSYFDGVMESLRSNGLSA